MTFEDSIEKYNKKFGPLPYWLLQGADDDYIVGLITRAFVENKPIDELDLEGDIY